MTEPSNNARPTSEPIERAQLDAHRAMVLWLFVATVSVSLVLGGIMIVTDPTLGAPKGSAETQKSSIVLFVVLAGALGGFVSCLRRLYAFDDIFPRKPYVVLFRRLDPYLIAYSTIPPVIGIIAAAVIYGMFAGRLLVGPIFPEFHCSAGGNACDTLPEFLGYWRPAGPTDFAKAMVWGFISGFSERYFVDILNQFGRKGADAK